MYLIELSEMPLVVRSTFSLLIVLSDESYVPRTKQQTLNTESALLAV